MARLRSAASWLGQVLAWLVILGIGAILVVALLIPRIAGATPYVILTGSMRPAMPPGTMVVVKPKPISQIGVGQVVTYQLYSGQPTVVTHRVIRIGINGRGQRRFTTKGDANTAADPKPVMPVQIRGARWYWIPYLGYVTNLLTGQQHQVATVVVAVILIGYAVWMFTAAARDRRRQRRTSRQASEEPEREAAMSSKKH